VEALSWYNMALPKIHTMFGGGEQFNLRETVLSYLSGVIFAIAWWLWIDAHAFSNAYERHDTSSPVTFGHYVPGIVSTFALVMINVVNWKDLGGFNWGVSEDSVQTRVRLWLFFSLVVGFGGVIAAIWSATDHWFNMVPKPDYEWPGIALILSNVLIFGSAMLYRFNSSTEDTGYDAL